MDVWIMIVAVVVLAAGIIGFVMSGPGMKEATTGHGHHDDHHEPAHLADLMPARSEQPVENPPASDMIDEGAPLASDPSYVAAPVAAVAEGLGEVEHLSSIDERAGLGDAPPGGGEGSSTNAEPVPYVLPADLDLPKDAAADIAEVPQGAAAVGAAALGDLEHESSIVDRASLGDGPHGGGEGSSAGAEPVPYVTSQAAVEPEVEVEQIWDGPFGPGSAEAAEDGSGPRGWTIKAARQSQVYLTPEDAVYAVATANLWFVNEQRALDAGFKRWQPPSA